MNSNINEAELVKNVEMMIKKDGSFDKIRKQVTENLKSSKFIETLEKNVQSKVNDVIMECVSKNLPKDEIIRQVKKTIDSDYMLRGEIKHHSQMELRNDYVNNELNKAIFEKTSQILDSINIAHST